MASLLFSVTQPVVARRVARAVSVRMAATKATPAVSERDVLLEKRGYRRGDRVVLFDGVCNMCNAGVDMVLQLDSANQFKYASLQGDVGRALLQMYDCPQDLSTMVYLDGEKAYLRSDAVLKIAERLRIFFAPAWLTLLVVPRPLRDWFYTNVVAKNRYTLFGKRSTCRLPSVEEQSKFLDLN